MPTQICENSIHDAQIIGNLNIQLLLCVYVCMLYVCTCVYMYVCVVVCVCMYICTCVCACMYICVWLCVCCCLCVCVCVCVRACACMCTCICTCICVCVAYITFMRLCMYVITVCVRFLTSESEAVSMPLINIISPISRATERLK